MKKLTQTLNSFIMRFAFCKCKKLIFLSFLTLSSIYSIDAQTITIGTGTNTSQHLPIEPYYGYTYSQTIWDQAEINQAGAIDKIRYYFNGNSAYTDNPVNIFMIETTKSVFTGSTDWVTSGGTLVYSGPITTTTTAGWVEIDITDFTYSNTNNLIIAVDENQAGYHGTNDDWYCTTHANYKSIYYYNDGTNPNPASPPSGTITKERPNIQLVFAAACTAPNSLSANNVTTQGADLGWTETGFASTWDIELGTSGFSPTGTPTANDVTANPYTYSGLNPSTSYEFYVRADCGGTQSGWSGPFSFSTVACNLQTPSALTATPLGSSAQLSWTENGNSAVWDIELGTAGFSPTGTPTANNVSSNPYNYTGLTPGTSYDYYVRAECGGSNSAWAGPYNFTTPNTISITIGTDNTCSDGLAYRTPYSTIKNSGRSQILILASELTAGGASAGYNINDLAFDVCNTNGTENMNNFTIKLGHTSSSALTMSAFETLTDLTTCFSNTIAPATAIGWRTHTFTTPFQWNGVDNVVVEICWENAVGTGGTFDGVKYTTWGVNRFEYYNWDVTPACSVAPGNVKPETPNVKLTCTPSPDMSYVSTTVTQPNTDSVGQGFTNQEIIRIEVVTQDFTNPLVLTQLLIRTDGSTDPIGDIVNTNGISIFYTGNSSAFSTSNLFGIANPLATGNDITVNGSQTLGSGSNYFWVAYDIDEGANTSGSNVVDAICSQITIDGSNYNNPGDYNGNPVGDRDIFYAPPTYTRFIGDTINSANRGTAILYDPADTTHVIAIAGRFDGVTAGSYDNLIVKVDQEGDTIWTVAYGTTSNDYPYDIIKTSDGGYLVVGQSNFREASAIKISSTGNLEWRTFINESDNNSKANAVVEASNGNFIMAGKGNTSYEDMYVWELDKTTGALQNSTRGYEYWFTLVAGGNPSQAFDIINTQDGGYALAGEIDSKPAVLKIANDFSIEWFMIWGSTNDYVSEIIENSANDYTVFISDHSGGASDFHVMRFTNSANNPSVVWEYTYDNTGDEHIEAAVATTGGYYIAGIGDIIGDPVNHEGYVMKITDGGSFVWDNYVGEDDVESYGIATAPSGAVVTGLSNVSGTRAFYSKVDQNSYSCSAVSNKPTTVTTSISGTTFTTTALGNGKNNGFATFTSSPALTKSSGFINSEACNTARVSSPLAVSSTIKLSTECINEKTILQWESSSSKNTLLSLEGSMDGIFFKNIKTVYSNSNSTTINSEYKYFRLSGKEFQSNTITSKCDFDNNIIVFPTIFENQINISVSSNLEYGLEYKLLNILGEVVLNGFIPKNENHFTIQIDKPLPSGAYILNIQGGSLYSINKLIKQ